MKTIRLTIVLAVFSLLGCSTSSVVADPADVTMVQLIASPEKYEGKHVRVIGFLHLEFESEVLYLHKEDFDHAIVGNGVWVDLGQEQQKLSDHYVLLEGVFTAKERGHMGMWSGKLKDINRSMIWTSPREPSRVPSPSPLVPTK